MTAEGVNKGMRRESAAAPNNGIAGAARIGHIHRVTRETDVEVTFVVDGHGRAEVSTGVGFLNHMLDSLARHGLFDIEVRATGDLYVDDHHSVEDVAIALGQALHQALGEGRGIRRMGHAIVPLDEALSMVAVDISGRGVSAINLDLEGPMVGDMKAQMATHFFQSLAMEAKMSLHVKVLAGDNDHHKVESSFKALAKSLDWATQIDERVAGEVPSTKGVL